MLLLFALLSMEGNAQQSATFSLKEKLTEYNERTLQEKLYLHLDRSFYIVGETIWFKLYYVEGSTHQMLDFSRIAYVEVLDNENNAVIQAKVALSEGTGEGSLVIPSSLESGNYTVRSYTNWMKNFSPDFYFETPITIVNTFSNLDPKLLTNVPSSIDLQFFPEGGNLVYNLESKIAFRGINGEGKGIDFKGFLLNDKNDTLVRFQPVKFGIGNFYLKPKSNENYRVVMTDESGKEWMFPFPKIQKIGYTLSVIDSTQKWIKVMVTSSQETSTIYLLGHTRSMSPFAQSTSLKNGEAVFLVDRQKLAEGITHFTIFDSEQNPVVERLYFKRPSVNLTIQVSVHRAQYSPREKINLEIKTLLAGNAPQEANLSVSVHLVDSLSTGLPVNIESFLYLTSELKGTIESPEYYMTKGVEVDRALDNLMITHGWTRFRWEDIKVFNGSSRYENIPEYGGHFVIGKVTDVRSGKPAPRIPSFLAFPGKKPSLFTSISDRSGMIRFEMKHFSGTKEIVVQSNTQVDSTYRIDISSPFSDKFSTRIKPLFGLNRSLEQILVRRSVNMQTFNSFTPKSYLFPVESETDTLGFYGAPSAKYFLDDYTRFPTIEEVMREYVPGVQVRRRQGKFHFKVADPIVRGTFFDADPLILLDGIPVFDTDKIIAFDPLKVKKLEVMTGMYYLGPLWISGIVSYTTYKGDLGGLELDPRSLVIQYDGVQNLREFYAPRYDLANAVKSRVPDFRNLLYWAPNVITAANGKTALSFFSSDQTGVYRVDVQGITKNGLPGNTSFTFEVKKSN